MKEFPDGVDYCGNVLKASLFHFCILKAFRTTEEVPRRKEGVQHLRVASCGLTSDFSVVFALLIVEAKTSPVVELFWSPFFMDERFLFVR